MNKIIARQDRATTQKDIIQRLDNEISFLEQEFDSDDPDLWAPDYAQYTLQVLYTIRGDV